MGISYDRVFLGKCRGVLNAQNDPLGSALSIFLKYLPIITGNDCASSSTACCCRAGGAFACKV